MWILVIKAKFFHFAETCLMLNAILMYMNVNLYFSYLFEQMVANQHGKIQQI